MALPTLTWGDAGLLVLYVLVLWLPGGLVLASARCRGWCLVAAAPLITYGLAGAGGPFVSSLGMPWRWWTLPLITVVAVTLVWAVARFVVSSPGAGIPAPDATPWHRSAHVAAGVVTAGAAAIGALAILVGIRNLRAIPQDWDAAYHANGIRWIVDTGDGSLSGMSQVNWYGTTTSQYYPNAYHLVAATVTDISGRDIPSVLNANTVLIPGVAALALAALIRRLGGSAVLAGAAAIVLVGMTGFYDMLWRGPLLPFAMGVALIAALLLLLEEFLRPEALRDRAALGVVLALGAAGLLALHPGALISAVVFAVAYLAARWWQRPRRIGAEGLALGACAVVAGVLVVPHILGSLQSAAESSVDWPAVTTAPEALGWALLFSHAAESLQLWITAALLIGLVTSVRLGPARWFLVPAVVFVTLFVMAAADDTPLVEALTRPWWNDRFRLVGIAAIPLAVVAGQGLASLAMLLKDTARRTVPALGTRPLALPVAATASALVLAGYLVVSHGSYLARNEARMAINVGEGPAVSSLEIEGMRVLGTLVPPDQRVMNDRGDGSVWMYALDGVRPVAGHYAAVGVDPDATLLAESFNEYDTDPEVRAASARLEVGWVVVDQGFLRDNAVRQPGLEDLDTVPELEMVYRNPDMTIYRLTPR